MSSATVIADASPLVALSLIDRLAWLHPLFGEVRVVNTVLQEVLTGQFDASERGLQAALHAQWIIAVTPSPHGATDQPTPWAMLDPGEADSIAYASSLAQKPLVLMDERAGRQVCTELGLPVVGTAGVMLLAKRRGLVANVKPEFERLHQAGFWIAPAVTKIVLQQAGEWP